ncbi:MAG: xanthine dehydrogenase molybdopterin binding subunit [Myxococcota bacterium]
MTERKKSPLFEPSAHESGQRHVTGAALYVDDLTPPRGMLWCHLITSPLAKAEIEALDTRQAAALPGVAAILTAKDIPGKNDIAPVGHDEPLLADRLVETVGQPIALVLAESLAAARAAERAIELRLSPRPALTSLEQAIAAESYQCAEHKLEIGTPDEAYARAAVRLEGVIDSGAQDHFYLETQAALATPLEDGSIHVASSTQHPSEVQAKVAEILGVGRHRVVVETARMGGGFGGKETQAAHFAAYAALGAALTHRPVKVWLNRDQDMVITGKRHPFRSKYRAGFSADGRLEALLVETVSDGGFSLDLSRAILDRCLFHLDNAYAIENARLVGRVAKTNLPSNTAFRGFGGPQGVLVIEAILDRAAGVLGLDPVELRRRNFYGAAPRNRTPYGQIVEDPRAERLFLELGESSQLAERKAEIARHNQSARFLKRGIAMTPVKFGISFTTSFLNQAGALVLIYADGSVQVNHGGTEMGQGLHTKMIAVAAHELGVRPARIRLMNTATDKVPNTSATAASSGSDLNGQAVHLACAELISRLRPIAAKLLGRPEDAERLVFEDDEVRLPGLAKKLRFEEVTGAAYLQQVPLAAAAHYRTPDIHFDAKTGRGKPFHYYAWGAAVSEVEVNRVTGEHKLLRVDILHDVGRSLVPTIDRGQIEGAFVQGLGWLTTEEVIFDAAGQLKTHSPDTYKIPAIGDVPLDFRVALLEQAEEPKVIHGSKAVGEPPLMLAISVVSALREAIAAFGDGRLDQVDLKVPATPEAVLRAIEALSGPLRIT